MIFIIGSQALNFYKKLTGRVPYDWDLLTAEPKGMKKLTNSLSLDFISASDPQELTNLEIFEYCKIHAHSTMKTPVGEGFVAPLQILKVLKLASLPVDKAKHQWDLLELNDIKLTPELESLAERRKLETVQRVKNQKSLFFNRYKIPRIFEHDTLHTYVASHPAYFQILKDNHAVEVDQNKFDHLNLKQRKIVLWEECLVLALERDLIPRIRKVPFFIEVIVENFSQIKNSESSALKWLGRLSLAGKLKDHPEWLAQWALANQKELLIGLSDWWQAKIDDLPEEFWDTLLA